MFLFLRSSLSRWEAAVAQTEDCISACLFCVMRLVVREDIIFFKKVKELFCFPINSFALSSLPPILAQMMPSDVSWHLLVRIPVLAVKLQPKELLGPDWLVLPFNFWHVF